MDYQTKGSLLVGLACSQAYFGRAKAFFDFMTVTWRFRKQNIRASKENDCTAGYGWPCYNYYIAVDIMAVMWRQVSQTLLSSTSLGEKCFQVH